MGLLDYYKQFSGMTEEEIGDELRTRAQERRQRALAKIETLDLSKTTWPEFPHPDVVAAVTFAARGALNQAPDPDTVELRRELARRSGLETDRVVAGHGAAQLLGRALLALLEPGDEVLVPWPSYGLYPPMVRRAGGRPVALEHGFDPERLRSAVGERTRVIVLCNPNDPTGEHISAAALGELLQDLPERVWVLLDEALGDFVAAEEPFSSLELLDDHPRLIAFRTLSKVYGLAGLRCGWALGGSGSEETLARLAPELGLSTPVQAGALEALHKCGAQVGRRRAAVVGERARILDALGELPIGAGPSEANFVWLRARGLGNVELAERLRRFGVLVWPGTEVGDSDHVRAAVQSPAASDRLIDALTRASEQAPDGG